jgi:hypothetical protein
MNITRFEPWGLIDLLHRDLDQIAGRRFGLATSDTDGSSVADWVPAVDIVEEKDRYVLRADVPGDASCRKGQWQVLPAIQSAGHGRRRGNLGEEHQWHSRGNHSEAAGSSGTADYRRIQLTGSATNHWRPASFEDAGRFAVRAAEGTFEVLFRSSAKQAML